MIIALLRTGSNTGILTQNKTTLMRSLPTILLTRTLFLAVIFFLLFFETCISISQAIYVASPNPHASGSVQNADAHSGEKHKHLVPGHTISDERSV